MFSIKLLGLLTFATLLGCSRSSWALQNGLALTPPMGWLAWERFACEIDCNQFPDSCINEHLFKDMAKRLVEDGYSELGYEYVNIDDCWSTHQRNPTTNRLVPDPHRFPNGIGSLAEHMHSLRLKLGIYGDCGTKTCAGYPAQLKFEDSLEGNYFDTDAATLAEWQIDSFKFDGCFIDPFKSESICPQMARAIIAHQRPILMTCEWPLYMWNVHATVNYTLAAESCNLWRYFNDVEDSWLSILSIIDRTSAMQDTIVKFHGPGNWFDPDMLVIGNFALSLEQAKAQMALWSIWSAPLFMSNDLRSLDPAYAAVLKNKRLIDLDQDRMGVFGLLVHQEADKSIQIFVKPIEKIKNGCPSFAILYLSRQTLGNGKKVSASLRDILTRAPLHVAAERYAQLSNSQGQFNAYECRERLTKSMTRQPTPEQLINRPLNQAALSSVEESSVSYSVLDLMDGKPLSPVSLDSTLDLFVRPSGARIVRLEEA